MKDPDSQHFSSIAFIGDASSSLIEALDETHRVAIATTKKAAIALLQEPPELLILNHTLEKGSGLDFLAAVRNSIGQALPPVIAILDTADNEQFSQALSLRCDDIIIGEPTVQELHLRVGLTLNKQRVRDALDSELDTLREQSERDPLTHLYNRRAFATHGIRELHKARRKQQCVSLLIFDIDHFKAINDEHGHSCGDDILVTFAECLRGNLRGYDLIGRHGGDEFVVILPDTTLVQAEHVCNKLLTAIREQPFRSATHTVQVLGTVGSATTDSLSECPIDLTLSCLLETADKGLYTAKKAGRDRCCCLNMQPQKTLHNGVPS